MPIDKYPLAPGGIFDTIQGEGDLLGTPMHFLRLAGCSIGCDFCDTDYSVAERLTVAEIVERLQRLPRRREWVWLTGGEPTDHDLAPLAAALQREGYLVAMATAGVRRVDHLPLAFLSVSPHGAPEQLAQRHGTQINLVPGLGGLRLADWAGFDFGCFGSKWVTPVWYGPTGRAAMTAECLEWVRSRAGWRLGCQAQKTWGVP